MPSSSFRPLELILASGTRKPPERLLRHGAARAAVGVLLFAGVALEGANTGFVPTALATTLCGALAWVALCAPQRLVLVLSASAVLCSATLSLVTTQLSHRPENTFGALELIALLLLVARSLRLPNPLVATVTAFAAAVTAGLAPLRLPQGEWDQLKIIEPAIMLSLAPLAALGIYLRMLDQARHRQRQAALNEQRLEYARELHDFVAHHVTAMVTQVKAIRYVTEAGHAPDTHELDELLKNVELAGTQALTSMRELVTELRAPGTGPTAAGTNLSGLERLTEAFTQTTRIPARLSLAPEVATRPLGPKVATTVHHLLQESLTNISRHATGAQQVEVGVRLGEGDPGRLLVTVADDGVGAKPSAGEGKPAPVAAAGYGIVGLTERVTTLGGTITAGPQDGRRGWRVTAEIPLRS
ncbi:sensor histidine kinase [Streptomyces sp. NBC_01716]|uniref:sensor histidine kinase n=1 Tax=Streptomyces sp. NBC_01716 TaxID=2975917 RepID=UPI002E319D77|nr:histidine kinase [Streptomyces sp. NBC_01716]